MKNILFFLLLLGFTSVQAQDYNLGIRAGLNYSTYMGPLETGESYEFNNGFHFGMNFAYNFTDLFAINTGLFYAQNGYKQTYDGDSYYILRLPDGNKLYEEGRSQINVEVSNAYINMPITANYFIGEKFEVYGGVYMNFLISPVGYGQWEFDSHDQPENISFIQNLDHRYFADEAATAQSIGEPIIIWVNEEELTLPDVANAYYFFDEKNGTKFNWFDFGLTGGASYYINAGLFFGVRASYGLTDNTNDDMDISIQKVEEDKQFIYRQDKDQHFWLEFSLGFRF